MPVDTSVFKSYDIRGIYPTQLNEESIAEITRAIVTFFQQKLGKKQITLVVGRDMRTSSPSLCQRVIETSVWEGAQVIDIGLCSTPTFYFAVNHYRYECGMQVTASHNPKEYNGVKFVLNSPSGLIKIGKSTGMEEVKALLAAPEESSAKQGGVSVRTDALKDEVAFALDQIKGSKLKPFKIVADPANAMGAPYIEALFEKIPGHLIKMNFDLDGSFPAHQPDPLDHKNLKDLQARVIAEQADFGLAPDGDGDRLFFIDEKGGIASPSIITGIIAKELLREHSGGKVLFDIRYILTPKALIEEAGGSYDISKVGHAFITEQMGATGALFAGESSAHYFYKATGNAESQVLTICYMLKVLSESGKSLSELVTTYQRSFESGEINFTVSDAKAVMDELVTTYSDGESVTLDGIAISYPTWRFNVRASNTEPLLRLNIEANTKEEMEAKRDELIAFIEKHTKRE